MKKSGKTTQSIEDVTLSLKNYENAVRETTAKLIRNNFVPRLWNKDASLWKQEPEHQKIIHNSLGWLTLPEWISDKLNDLLRFSEAVKKSGVKDLVLLGMGGSSLAPELFRLCLPAKKGYPKLHVLDSTDPGWVGLIEKSVNLKKTLFIVSSKSGSTIEPLSFYNYFFDRAQKNGKQFIAITDPGSYLQGVAGKEGFLKVFLNPSDIGGRFSALSYFGLVPAALAGMDVKGLVQNARKIGQLCRSNDDKNPGLSLGVVLGALAQAGRDKITLVLDKKLEAFGLWIEQLVAESSGKEGHGIVPIVENDLSGIELYGPDRLFVSVTYGTNSALENKLKRIQSGHPVVRIVLKEPANIGAEFMRWEIATATACSILGVNAFDQPDVQAAKDLAKSVLKNLEQTGSLPAVPTHFETKNFKLTLGKALMEGPGIKTVAGIFPAIKAKIRPGDYLGLLAFLPFEKATDEKLMELKLKLRNALKLPVLFGYGPRYLHSTGQLHKGGPNNGIFIVLTADARKDLKVPDQNFSFGQLESAQALGDFQALDTRGRRTLKVHLQSPLPASLVALTKLVDY